jgi:HdeA/HdeB family
MASPNAMQRSSRYPGNSGRGGCTPKTDLIDPERRFTPSNDALQKGNSITVPAVASKDDVWESLVGVGSAGVAISHTHTSSSQSSRLPQPQPSGLWQNQKLFPSYLWVRRFIVDLYFGAQDTHCLVWPCPSALEPWCISKRTSKMKLRLISTAFAVSLIPVAANAQVISMDALTCSEYLAMPPAASRDFSAWMSGWYSYQTRRTFVDVAAHQKNIANYKSWCQYHPQASVMEALQSAIGPQ